MIDLSRVLVHWILLAHGPARLVALHVTPMRRVPTRPPTTFRPALHFPHPFALKHIPIPLLITRLFTLCARLLLIPLRHIRYRKRRVGRPGTWRNSWPWHSPRPRDEPWRSNLQSLWINIGNRIG